MSSVITSTAKNSRPAAMSASRDRMILSLIGDDGSIFQQSAADVLIDPARIRHFQYGIGGGVAFSCAMRTAISGMALALGTLWLASSAAQSAPSTASLAPVA